MALISAILDQYMTGGGESVFERIYIFSPSIEIDDAWKPVKGFIEQHMGVNTEREQVYFDKWDEGALRTIIQQQKKITRTTKELGFKKLYQILVVAPREVAPGRDALFKHVGRRGLGVPALAHVGEAREGRPAPVPRELHVGQVRQVPLAGLLHIVLGAEDGCRELAVGQGVLAAPDHVYSVADPLRLVAVELEDQRRGDST